MCRMQNKNCSLSFFKSPLLKLVVLHSMYTCMTHSNVQTCNTYSIHA